MIRLVILRIFESYFRHRWLYLLPLLIMVASGIYYISTTKPSYSARGILYVQNESFLASLTEVSDNSLAWWTSPSQATTAEIIELIQTDAFVRAIIQQTDLETKMNQSQDEVDELLKETRQAVRVRSQGDSQVNISASHENPQVTYQLVNSVIDVYLQWLINAQRGQSIAAQEFFTELISAYEADLESARLAMREYLDANPIPVRGNRSESEAMDISGLQSEIDLAAVRFASALDKDESIRLSLAQVDSDILQSYQLIDAPRFPEKPNVSLRQLAINFGVFVIVGIILFSVAVVAGAIFDRSLRFESNVTHLLHLPVLTIVPDISERKRWYQRFRRARDNTQVASEEGEPVIIEFAPENVQFGESNIQNGSNIKKTTFSWLTKLGRSPRI